LAAAPTSLHILALIALAPFALVAFLWREAHVDLRQTLLSMAAIVTVLIVVAAALFEI
jgi:hypothetical protein